MELFGFLFFGSSFGRNVCKIRENRLKIKNNNLRGVW